MPKPKRQDDYADLTQDDEQMLTSFAYRDDLAKNRLRRVSDRQRDRMRGWSFEFSPEESRQIYDGLERQRIFDFSSALVTFGFITFLILLIVRPGVQDGVIEPLFGFIAVVLFGVVSLYRMKPRPLTRLEIAARYRSELEARRNYMREMGDQRRVIRVQGVPTYKAPDSILIDGVAYRVDAPLWRWLREHSQQVAIYAIKEWHPPYALSAEPLDVPIPLTPEERLRGVIGVNSEGELVYADDPPHEDGGCAAHRSLVSLGR